MAIKKSDLYSSLWASCDELRGGMDASQYKDYILVLLFVKYVSDKYEDQNNFPPVIIPEGASFKDMVKLKNKPNIGEGINTIIEELSEANGLLNIIGDVDFDEEKKLGPIKERNAKLTKLIGIFETQLNFSKNKANGDDLLGDAYEYLMMNFAAESGKSKGQFYTPSEVSNILAKVIGISKSSTSNTTVYDPTCGSGSLLIKAADEANVEGGISIYGQEKDSATTILAHMNMILHGHVERVIAPNSDTISSPAFKLSDTNLKTFDYIVANPPFSTKSWSSGLETDEKTKKLKDDFNRFEFGTPPEKNGDYAFMLHIIKSLKNTGTAAVILPHGVLFRGNAEGCIRKEIVKRKLIKGIIGLPANLFYGTGIPACILVIDKHGANDRDGIFMVDASKGFTKDGNKNRLRAQDIHKIVDVFTKEAETAGFARMVPLSEISDDKNDYNLNLPRYIDSNEAEDLHDLAGHLKGGIPKADIDDLEHYWSIFKDAREQLFTNNAREGYLDPKVSYNEINSVIRGSANYVQYLDGVHDIYNSWVAKNKSILENLKVDDNPKHIIAGISESILEEFGSVELLDNYNIYQYLMTYWNETMQDDFYQIVTDGWLAASSPRKIEKGKDKSGKAKWLEDGDFKFGTSKSETRYVTDLIPPALIISKYFAELQSEINDVETQKETLNQEFTELVENNSGDSDLLAEAKNDSDNITKTTVENRIKAINKDKKSGLSIDTEELTELGKVKGVLVAIAAFDKELKAKTLELNNQAFAKYRELTEEDVKNIVVNDKWLKAMETNVNQELDKIVQNLTDRVKTLTERYQTTLPELEDKVEDYADKVKQHLAKMGLTY